MLTFLFGIFNISYYLDDGLIYARYVQNFSDGNGLVYNKGEYFNGLTSPLFTYLSVALSFIIKDTIIIVNVISAFFHALCTVVFFSIFKQKTNDFFLILATLLLACSPYFLELYTMETSLYVFLIGVSIYYFQKEKFFALGVALALLILTRSEGVFLLVSMLIIHFYNRRPFPNWTDFLLPTAIFISHFLFNYFYYGAFLPETASAKILHGQSGFWTVGLAFIAWFYIVMSYWGLSLVLLPLAIYGLITNKRVDLSILILIYSSILLSFYVFLNIPHYQWYYAPFVVCLIYLSGIGLGNLYELVISKVGVLASKFTILLLVAVISFDASRDFSLGRNGHPYKDIGLWLKNNTEPDARIAMVEIGIVGYFSERPIIDILGLVNPFNAEYTSKGDVTSWMTKYEADYILAHVPAWKLETSVDIALKSGDFSLASEFQASNYYEKIQQLLINSSELIIYF